MRLLPSGRTALSHLAHAKNTALRHFCALARRSQGSAAVLATALSPALTSGCIVAEAPDYGPSQRTPIYLSDPHPSPSNLQLLNDSQIGPTMLSFGVTFRSEDAGEAVISVMYVDYKHAPAMVAKLDKHYHPASTFDNPRPVNYPVAASAFAGREGVCHSLTLMLMHESGWDDGNNVPIGAPSDLATMTWFVSVNDMGTPLSQCPTASTEMP